MQQRALLGQQRAAGAAEDAGGLGREVPAAGEQLGAGPSAITRPSASSTARSAQAAANSGSWVATITACPLAARAAQLLRQLGLGRAVHPARGLVEREHRRRLARRR